MKFKIGDKVIPTEGFKKHFPSDYERLRKEIGQVCNFGDFRMATGENDLTVQFPGTCHYKLYEDAFELAKPKIPLTYARAIEILRAQEV